MSFEDFSSDPPPSKMGPAEIRVREIDDHHWSAVFSDQIERDQEHIGFGPDPISAVYNLIQAEDED